MEERMDLRISYFPGKFIQGNSAIDELPGMIDLFGGRAFMLVTPSMVKMVKEHGYERYDYEEFTGACCWTAINGVIERIRDKDYTVVVGIGGGRIVDTAKAVADKLDLHVILVPTVAASSAAYSACSVIYTEDNVEEGVYYEKHSPDVLLLDNSLIIGASTRHFVAGMGDALAVFYEGRACRHTGAANSLHGNQTFCALAMCDYCYETLLEYGYDARTAYDNKAITPAVERIIELNLLCAGIAFEGAGLAAAHAIHNGLTIMPEAREYLHGEIVAFGVQFELHLSGADPDEMEEVYSFCEEVGLPTTLADIGLGDLSDDDLDRIAQFGWDDPYMHHENPNITPHDIKMAVLAADAMGRERKGEDPEG